MASRQVFGQTMRKKDARSNYQRQFGGGGKNSTIYRKASDDNNNIDTQAIRRRRKQAAGEVLDDKIFGLERFTVSTAPAEEAGNHQKRQRRGWLYNMMATTVTVSNDASIAASGGPERSGLDLFFCTDSGNNFKTTILYRPYFYVLPDLSACSNVDIVLELLLTTIQRLLEGSLYHVEVVYKTDLDQPNHLSPRNLKGRPVLKLVFDSVSLLMEGREQIREIVDKNTERGMTTTFCLDDQSQQQESLKDPLRLLMDIREYDVPYVVRVCTDMDIRAGTWYTVELDDELEANDSETGGVRLLDPDRESKANPTFFAFDIECTKAPLKFPSADVDEIFMISYMVSTATGSQGYLIVSKSVVSQDIEDFEYTPKPTYPGPFHIFNEPDEKALLERFFEEYRKHRPQIVVTYNGDFFDWPFVDARAKHYGLDLFSLTGVENVGDEYRGRASVHLDAFHWVQRDSYLPQGAQGLKAVTKYKLGYDPVEVDPEDMVRFAQERPVHMATYSVSDAVATYYLYEKYVHLFIFSLCTIIPMGPEDVLRKGSGTLCESLLMAQACSKSIICPNKQVDPLTQFHKGHLLESETYIGGKVECLETGVYRSDLEYDFDLDSAAFQELIDNIDRDLTFAIEVEGGQSRNDIVNYDEVKAQIIERLEKLRDKPKRCEKPYVYHLDVGAMYPNIILTNRLQPSAIVDDAACAACDFNQAKNGCKRRMEWVWRGDYSPSTHNEYERTKDQLSRETFRDGLAFHQLPKKEQATLIASRLKEYSRKAYKKTKVTEEELRQDVVCERENPFYVDTVRQFRDRRYEFKKANKDWKTKLKNATDAASRKQCEDKVLVYDSLQVAHKCILNSFYGYVMRKGARWRSMEMAGIVTKTGADIITQARLLVERIGRPLELDTDGIWCILPISFPDVYNFVTADGSKLKLEYPCVMLNAACHDKFTNDQYQTLVDPERGIYETRSECSIFFEVDGPYRCMFLPASTEEGKLLKKRYAVFNFDKSLAELKGFELKRRGELELIKTFQSQVFERFLDGGTLEECYESAAEIANHWIDVIDTRGESLDDDELVDLISENRSMSRQLDDYGDQKGTSQTTARRLGEFLGNEIIKDKGLNCKFIIAEQPYGAPVTERAIPTAIWKAEPNVTKHFLRKWLKSPGLDGDGLDMRNILDWDYYLDRLGKTIQKIITIPAALQKIKNPVPRVPHPHWLESKVNQQEDRFKQTSIRDMFKKLAPARQEQATAMDIEDFGMPAAEKLPMVHRRIPRTGDVAKSGQDDTLDANEERTRLSKETFPDWLRQRKSLWRKTRRERRFASDSRTTSSFDKRARKAISMDGFVREAALSLSQREWQILEVRGASGFDSLNQWSSTSSGDFTVWAMVGDSLQKIIVSVPRKVYVSTRKEITSDLDHIMDFRKVDKHLPHSKSASYLYEVTMAEHIYKSQKWVKGLRSVDDDSQAEDVLEAMYESETPLIVRILSEVGVVARLNASDPGKSKKTYDLADFSRLERPSEGEYLHRSLSYKRAFLYIRLHPRNKTGIVALYFLNGGSGSFAGSSEDGEESSRPCDITRPSENGQGSFDIGASCHVWVVKPGSRSGQRNLSLNQCGSLFTNLLETIQEAASPDSDYACVSSQSKIRVSSLKFVDNEEMAYGFANEAINSHSKSSSGPMMILLNSNRPASQLRRTMSTFTSFPVLSMPFPPGPAHNPSISSLPALNWEQPAVQLCFEAYLFATVISFPKRVSYARYGQVPVGNLGQDENFALYDVVLSRLIQKNRAISWASGIEGHPDLGVKFLPSSDGGAFPAVQSSVRGCDEDEIWGDDDDLAGPVVRRPGCFRHVCVDIDVQDLAIAAMTDMSDSAGASRGDGGTELASPNSVTFANGAFNTSKLTGPLGDEMSTSVSLPIIRTLVHGWLKDAYVTNSLVADELLHYVYRLLSSPESILYDPALHRILSSLMKSTFLRLLGELQRLGCHIVFASFSKVTVATNKVSLAEAEEYVDFVISTVRKRASDAAGVADALARVSLRPRQFHSHFVFLDEFNFGSMLLSKEDKEDVDESEDLVLPIENDDDHVIVPSVVTGWSVMNYLGSEIAVEYFRAIIGRFSKDPFKKQMELCLAEANGSFTGINDGAQRLLDYKKMMVSRHFASYLTRAVDEILKDGVDDKVLPPLLRDSEHKIIPALEFIKNITVVLELDSDVEAEVQILKRNLLAQVGVAEYAKIANWRNPCPSFILPDVFCNECHESRDLNICYVPPRAAEEDFEKMWVCDDCGSPYDSSSIERRLIGLVHRKVARYQLQDLRCAKTNRVVTRALNPMSETSTGLKLETSPNDAESEIRLLHSVAEFRELENLKTTTGALIKTFR